MQLERRGSKDKAKTWLGVENKTNRAPLRHRLPLMPYHGQQRAKSPGEIEAMTAPTLISGLDPLGLQTAGPKAAREQRLRALIGIKNQPSITH